MKGASPRERHGGPAEELDSSPVVTLLLFEAADCLMALPASEVARLLAPESQQASADEAGASVPWIDLDEYFSGRRSEGPWLRWDRGERCAWLRVGCVVEVLACAIQALAPMPACFRSEGRGGAFWGAGVRGDEVFLLMDPARLADRRAEYGDERDPAVRKFLVDLSPVTHADKLRTPLMIEHGRQDSRVPVSQVEEMAAAARKRGVPVWTIVFDDEGHDPFPVKPANTNFHFYAWVLFAQKYLLN